MSSSSSAQTVAVHKKRLEGVRRTDTLKDLLDQSLSMVVAAAPPREEEEEDQAEEEKEKEEANGDILVLCRPPSKKEAQLILLEFKAKMQEVSSSSLPSATEQDYAFIPIPVLRSMATLLGEDRVERALEQQQQQQVDSTTTTSLVFTPPITEEPTLEQQSFRKRMDRLRLKAEECEYRQLTQNLGNKVQADDDVTTRSMTYAASIGLNMIIAPLSFGCFMYFFAGGLLDYFFPINYQEELQHHRQHHHAAVADIRKVIAGVVSGVLMLFVEMILFVIRTHEMDKAMRRKAKKSKKEVKPFGYYTAMTTKTYKED